MKKAKSFKVDDKVFAKVKGYPAWPAQVVAVNGKKYDVKFYGTGETGCLKPEDLFYYLKHKSQFVKSLKRKDYKDAIDQIEQEIEQNGGTDGSHGDNVDSELDESAPSTPSESKRSNKRKRTSSGSDPAQLPKSRKNSVAKVDEEVKDERIEKETSDLTEEKIAAENAEDKKDELKSEKSDDKKEEDEKEPAESKLDESAETEKGFYKEIDKKEESESEKENQDDCKSKLNENNLENILSKDLRDSTPDTDVEDKLPQEYKDMTMIPHSYLQAIITFAQKIKENENIYKEKKPELSAFDEDKKIKVFPVKNLKDKYVGIKFVVKRISEFDNEYDRAMDDERLAKEILELRNSIVAGKPIDANDERIIEMNLSHKLIHQTINDSVFQHKTSKVNWLSNETKLYDSILAIKKSLSLDNAEPKEAIKHLENISLLKVDPISLKKHPDFMNTLERLKKYVGNTKTWNLSSKELSDFTNDADTIRNLAEQVSEKLKALFPYKDDEKFYDKFAEDCSNLKKLVTNESEFLSLTAEPYTRSSILDQIYGNSGNKNNADIES